MTDKGSIAVTVDGCPVRGRIVSLHLNDITVEITEPFTGISAGTHIMAQVLDHIRYERDGELTDRGRERAELLLGSIFRLCVMFRDDAAWVREQWRLAVADVGVEHALDHLAAKVETKLGCSPCCEALEQLVAVDGMG